MEEVDGTKNEVQSNNKSKSNNVIIGCTIISDFRALQIESLLNSGITKFQLLAEFSREGVFKPPNGVLGLLKPESIIFHMPFYFHLLMDVRKEHKTMFRSFNGYWKGKNFDHKVPLIVHSKGIKLKPLTTLSKMRSRLIGYSKLVPTIKLLVENDCGGKNNPAPSIAMIAKVVKALKKAGLDIGMCVDTEHAYAAGDSLFPMNYKDVVDLVHLNAIPKNVRYGGHLDRHSQTALSQSKNGTGFVKKIISSIKPGTPLILERTEYDIIQQDMSFLKERRYV